MSAASPQPEGGMASRRAARAAHPSARWRSVVELLDAHAADTPDAPALAFPERQSSFAEVAEATIRSARSLAALGVRPGHRVGVLLRTASLPYVSIALGAVRLGAIAVPINARNRSRELGYVMGHAGLRVLVTEERFRADVEAAQPPEGCTVVVVEPGELLPLDASARGPADAVAQAPPADPHDPMLILYTSGSTADPKGCLLSHANLLGVGENCAQRLQFESADRFWTPLTFFHVGGWQGLMTAWARGGCLCHVGVWDPDTALAQLERQACTVVFPAFELMWMAVLDHPGFAAADLSALRIVINVGVPERMEQMQSRVPHATQLSCLGMTESTGSMCMGAADDSPWSRSHTSGRPLAGMELRVADFETGEECPAGVNGELLFRGVTQFGGYYRDEPRTAEIVDADGWVRTGDIARWNEDGTATFVGRLKEMLKVGGENVSSAEVEGLLLTHPAVAMVAVVPAPDARYGEVPAAFVQLHPGAVTSEDELIAHCLGTVATFKVPRYVRILDDMPATASGKIQKLPLAERLAAELRERGITEAPRLAART